MALSLYTAPSGEPLSLAEAKYHLKVDSDDDNGLIDTLIGAAREHVETFTHRRLLAQTWDQQRDHFPCDEVIWLPYPPVSAISSISYIDTNGATQTWSSSLYTTDLPAGPQPRMARIAPAYGEFYPSTRHVMNAVTVRFVCGYGQAGNVPHGILAAMKLLIGHWYMNRESVSVNVGNVTAIPMGVDALLWPFKAF